MEPTTSGGNNFTGGSLLDNKSPINKADEEEKQNSKSEIQELRDMQKLI
jgi:hypothetical protein